MLSMSSYLRRLDVVSGSPNKVVVKMDEVL